MARSRISKVREKISASATGVCLADQWTPRLPDHFSPRSRQAPALPRRPPRASDGPSVDTALARRSLGHLSLGARRLVWEHARQGHLPRHPLHLQWLRHSAVEVDLPLIDDKLHLQRIRFIVIEVLERPSVPGEPERYVCQLACAFHFETLLRSPSWSPAPRRAS